MAEFNIGMTEDEVYTDVEGFGKSSETTNDSSSDKDRKYVNHSQQNNEYDRMNLNHPRQDNAYVTCVNSPYNMSSKTRVRFNTTKQDVDFDTLDVSIQRRNVAVLVMKVVVGMLVVVTAIVVMVTSVNTATAVVGMEGNVSQLKKQLTGNQERKSGDNSPGNRDTQNGSSVCSKHTEDKYSPNSACVFRQGFCPRQVVSLTDGYDVLCDTVSDGGGWIVFQRRSSFDVDFNQNWQNYTEGFGELTGDFWLGLDKVYKLCSKALCELRIDFRYQDVDYYAEYDDFWITGPDRNYTLNLGRYHGNAGDGMTSYHKGAPFSTYDRDNDVRKDTNCATKFGGPWWQRGHGSSSTLCYKRVSLNGRPGSTAPYTGVVYYDKTGASKSASFTEMKVRWYSR